MKGKIRLLKTMHAELRRLWALDRDAYRKWAHRHPDPKMPAPKRHIRIKVMPGCGQNRANSPCDICPAGEYHACPNRVSTVGFVK